MHEIFEYQKSTEFDKIFFFHSEDDQKSRKHHFHDSIEIANK